MSANRPHAAIIVSSIGLGFQILALLIEFVIFTLAIFAPLRHTVTYGPFIFFWSTSFVMMGLILILVGVIGIHFMNSGERGRVSIGGLLLIVASVFAFPTMFGFFIGSFLMFVGGILAIVWAPVKGA
ncbi:MAG: hypothetical protein ACP5NC_03005 [Nitrososphaeria archaeon]